MQWWERMCNGMEESRRSSICRGYVCLVANSEEDIKVIMEKVNECGLKDNEKKFKVVYINGEVGRRRWMMGN